MKSRSSSLFVIAAMATSVVLTSGVASAANLYWKTTVAANAWTGSFWGAASGGPYTSAWTAGSTAIFEDNGGTTLLLTGATTNVAGITANENVTVTAAGTLGTGGTVATIEVASGKTFNFQGQALSTAAGTGFVKTGLGTLSLTGATYPGGLTISAGTVAAGGVNALGAGGPLTIAGGTTLRSTSTAARDFTGKQTAITINGDFTLGDAINNGGLTFSAPTALGAATRTLTLNSAATFNGALSGDPGVGLTKAGTGLLTLGGANTYDGPTTATAGTLLFSKRVAFYNADVSKWTAANLVLSPSVVLGFGVGGTGDFTPAEIVSLSALTTSLGLSAGIGNYNFAEALTSGSLTKLGTNTLMLSGASTYPDGTSITSGFVQVATIGMAGDSSPLGTNGTIDITTGTGGLIYSGAGETTDKVIRYNTASAGGVLTNSGGPLVFTNPFTTPATAAFGVTFNGAGTTTLNGIVSPQAMNFNKQGVGILNVAGQVLTKYASPNGNLRADGGILRMTASSSTGSGTDAGGLTRAGAGGGVLQIVPGASVYTITANTNGILGGWALYDNTTWAMTNGTATPVSGLASFTNDTWAAGNNTDVTTSSAVAANSLTNSLRFSTAVANTVTLSGINSITSGGILVTSAVGANPSAISGGSVSTTLASGVITIHNHNSSGALTVGSVIGGTVQAGSFATTQKVITGLTNTAGFYVGMPVTGTGIAANSTIASIDSATQVTLNNNTSAVGTAASLSFGNAIGVTKVGAGDVVFSGTNTYTGTTNVLEGKLTVNANSGGKVYNLSNLTTLELGYSTGDSVYNYGVTVNGAGTAAMTGLYLNGGMTYTLQSALTLAGGPTTVRGYGTGAAVLAGWDNNGTHLVVQSTASGSVIDSNVNFKPGGYGYVMNIAAGDYTATGDVTFQGQFTGAVNGNSTHFRKVGLGSLLLTGASTNTAPLDIRVGSVILGGSDRIGTGAAVYLGNGTGSGKLVLNGNNQTLANLYPVGTGTANAVVGGSSTLSTLTLNYTGAGQVNAATLGGTGTDENNLAFVKMGTGTYTLSGTNTYTGGTVISGGALELGSLGAVGTTGILSMNGGTLRFSAANTEDYTARLRLEDETISGFDTNGQDLTFASTLATGASGSGGLNKLGAGILTISANQSYQGTTQVTGGTLLLDYSTANGSKLSDTADLTLAGGTLILTGGSHREVAGATYVTGNSTIDRSGGSATIALGEIARSGVVTLNIAATGIATTTTPNDGSGKLPAWITVAGGPASNDGTGNIIPFSGFVDIVRLGGKIPSSPTANVRIVNGGFVGDITPLAPGLTHIASLSQIATAGDATLTLGAADTLRLGTLGEITVPAGSSPLIIQSGTLTSGDADDSFGDLSMTVDSSLAVLSAITNNGTGTVSLTKTGVGTLTLGGVNSYTGDTTITAGTLRLNHAQALGLGKLIIKGGVIDNTSSDPIIVADTIPQQWDGDFTFTGTKDLSFTAGTVTLSGNRAVEVTNGTLSIGGALNGAFTLTKSGAGTLSLASGSWNGLTTVTAGTLEVLTKTNDVPYAVNQGATLKLGYVTGGGYANTNLKVYGDGVNATTGLYLKGGASYNCSATLELLTAPTTIRHYGTGLAALGMFDINGTGLSVSAAASGSVIDENIELVSRGYGMAMNVVSGANNATGDLIVGGPLNAGILGLNKRGNGSILLKSAGTDANAEVRILGGSVIAGIANALGQNSLLQIDAGCSLKLNGFSQSARNLSSAGSVTNGSPTPATLTLSQAADTTFTGVLGGAGANDNNFGLTKGGTFQLTLTGANTYSGDTSVVAGTLSLNQAYLADGSAVRVTTGGTLNFNHSSADTVFALYVDGVQKPAGTYSSGNSSFITGAGSLVVTSGPAGYDAWAVQIPDPAQRGAGNDPDGDSLNNLLEYALGGNPNLNDAATIGPKAAKSGSNMILTFGRSDLSEADTTMTVEYGSDLNGWTSVAVGASPGAGIVAITENADAPDAVTVTIPTGGADKFFARVKVVK
jgi:autotransporter-associated beta strand protein